MNTEKVVVVGLGYVGLPLAIGLARNFPSVVGLDISTSRVTALNAGHDSTKEVESADLAATTLTITNDPNHLADATFIIVTVPTPIDALKRPDLEPVKSACRMIGPHLQRHAVVVFESTVYPGVTEDICGPIISALSGLSAGSDFSLGYSPERINPGDKTHRLETITKIIAADSPAALERLRHVYGAVVRAGLHEAPSIRVAEAAKVIENAQRDINIAFINEVTRIFADDGISIWDVLEAAKTKWNFLPFEPGLVGGHCIGVDPYYLSHKAEMLGHAPEVILSGRHINDDVGRWVADRLHGLIGRPGVDILVLGLTFKENVPDLRNSKVADVIRRLEWLGHKVTVHDPLADTAEAAHEYGLALDTDALQRSFDAVFAAVPHCVYQALEPAAIGSLVRPNGLLFDFKRTWRDQQTVSDALPPGARLLTL